MGSPLRVRAFRSTPFSNLAARGRPSLASRSHTPAFASAGRKSTQGSDGRAKVAIAPSVTVIPASAGPANAAAEQAQVDDARAVIDAR